MWKPVILHLYYIKWNKNIVSKEDNTFFVLLEVRLNAHSCGLKSIEKFTSYTEQTEKDRGRKEAIMTM